MDGNHIQTIASVAIGANGIISWWEGYTVPLIKKTDQFAFEVFCTFLANKRYQITREVDQLEYDVANTDIVKASAKKVKDIADEKLLQEELESRREKLNQIGKYEINTGVSTIMVHLLRLSAFVGVFAGILVLIFAERCSMCINETHLLLLFSPQALAFLFLIWLYLGKILPIKPLWKLSKISLAYAWEYERELVKKYFLTNSQTFEAQAEVEKSLAKFLNS